MESGGRVSGAILSRLGGVLSAVEELWSVTAPGLARQVFMASALEWGAQATSTGIIFAVPGPDAEPRFLHRHPSFLYSWGSDETYFLNREALS